MFKGHEKNPHIEALGKYLNGVGRVYTSTHLSVLKALLKNTTS
ncbi:MAG: hypothetical protein Q8O99_05960 [bacterium]|nr:hypothetical protein [bacterium]